MYSFTGRFTDATGNQEVTFARKVVGEDVYFTITYQDAPAPVTFSLTGLTPADDRVSGDGTYTFTPNTTNRTQTIHFKTTDANSTCVVGSLAPAEGAAYSTPSPNTFQLIRKNRIWKTGSYTIDLTSYVNYNTNSFTSGVQNVVFSNAEGYYSGNGNNRRYFKAMGVREWDWGFDYYSGSFTVNAPSSLEEARITGLTMAYFTSGSTTYNQQNVTVTVGTSSTVLSSNKTTWTSSSTGEGNGDSTVTVTMSCNNSTQYDNRNRLTSLTVNYGYWDYE